MCVVVRIRGRPAVGDVNVAATRRRRLERPLPPRTFVRALVMMVLLVAVLATVLLTALDLMVLRIYLLTVFEVSRRGRIRVERLASRRARLLQAQHRPLADSARRAVLRVPRVVAASRRPGAKRIPGRGVVHDGLHMASKARDSPLPLSQQRAGARRARRAHVLVLVLPPATSSPSRLIHGATISSPGGTAARERDGGMAVRRTATAAAAASRAIVRHALHHHTRSHVAARINRRRFDTIDRYARRRSQRRIRLVTRELLLSSFDGDARARNPRARQANIYFPFTYV